MSALVVWRLPCRSQEFNEGPRIQQGSGSLTIAYDFETDAGYAWEELMFTGVAAFSFTAARYCTEDQIGAYDRLEEVSSSQWTRSLRDVSADSRHYRIYFDDVGCYEVLARSFVPPAEEP
jgi:hypothetical protein